MHVLAGVCVMHCVVCCVIATDPDVRTAYPVLRLTPDLPYRWWHAFQHLYVLPILMLYVFVVGAPAFVHCSRASVWNSPLFVCGLYA
jgi:hypothetical protein